MSYYLIFSGLFLLVNLVAYVCIGLPGWVANLTILNTLCALAVLGVQWS